MLHIVLKFKFDFGGDWAVQHGAVEWIGPGGLLDRVVRVRCGDVAAVLGHSEKTQPIQCEGGVGMEVPATRRLRRHM